MAILTKVGRVLEIRLLGTMVVDRMQQQDLGGTAGGSPEAQSCRQDPRVVENQDVSGPEERGQVPHRSMNDRGAGGVQQSGR
jgi:hypothetical protein